MKTIVILNIYRDTSNQKPILVVIGIFSEKGQKEIELTLPADLFPSDLKRNQRIYFSTLSPL